MGSTHPPIESITESDRRAYCILPAMRISTLTLLCGAAICLLYACSRLSGKTTSDPLQVRVTGGEIVGFRESGVIKHLGVPFAAPPVGDLRWREPQPVRPWSLPRDAKAFASSPMSHNVFGDMKYRSPGFSEDCLYLNVWSPDSARVARPRPVLVYFYGGGFVAGASDETRYDGAALAREGIVVVTVNYRLNVFGFLALPELAAESPHGASGNYGMLDQAAGLAWVRDNIRAFGGDPARVTIGGESAGSWSVSAHCGSPLSQNLFAGAIGQSGGSTTPFEELPTREEAFGQGLAAAQVVADPVTSGEANVTLAALRAIPADTMYARYRRSRPALPELFVDGYFKTAELEDSYASGAVAKVPLLVGWTSAEGGDGSDVLKDINPSAAFAKTINDRFADKAPAMLAIYPHATPAEAQRAAADYNADQFIVMGTWLWSTLHREATAKPVYRYIFAQPSPGKSGGASHASDIPYAMGNLAVHDDKPYADGDAATERAMLHYLANFIKSGNPNQPSSASVALPVWPAADATAAQRVLYFEDGARVKTVNDTRWHSLRALTQRD